MMKRIVAFLFFASFALIALALVLPGFINWNNHKELIAARMEPYIKGKIEIAGDVHFQVLPNPRIVLEEVSVDKILKLKTLEARIRLKPLLEGRFEVDTIDLQEPDVTFETTEDGTANWNGVLRDTGAKIGGAAVRLNQVTISQGKLHYINRVTGTEWHVDQLNLRIAADTLLGPYRIIGDMLYDGKQVSIEIGSGKYDNSAPMPLRVAFLPKEGLPEVRLNGVADLKKGFDVQGTLEIVQGTLGSLFTGGLFQNLYFMNDAGDLSAVLDIKGSEIKLSDMKVRIGQKGSVTGKLAIQLARGAKPLVTADLEAKDIKAFGKKGFMPGPENFDLHLDVKGQGITWKDLFLPSLNLSAKGNEKEWVVKRLSIEMPGQSIFQMAGLVTPKDKSAAMKLDLSADDLSQAIPGLPFSKIKVGGNLDISADKISLYNFDATPDAGKITGAITVDRTAEKFSVDVNASGDVAGLKGFAFKGKVVDRMLEGELNADNLDFDEFSLGVDGLLDVKAKKLSWRQNDVADARFKLETSGPKVRVSGLTGKMWGGDLFADSEGEKGAGSIKGKLVSVDIDHLRTLMELDGFSLGKGDIVFDLKDDGTMNKMFHALSGEIKIKTSALTIDKFDIASMEALLAGLTSAPDDLQDQIVKALKSGDAVYKDAEAVLKVGKGKFTFDEVELSNADAEVKLKGEYDIGPEKYGITADVKPKSEIPGFTVTAPGYALDAEAFKEYIIKNNPVEEPAPAEPAAPVEQGPADPVKGIIERLDESEQAAPSP